MKSCQADFFKIHCGLKEGYDGPQHTIEEAYAICQSYCDENPIGLSISPTKFIYHKGAEDGFVVTLINYPRFPKSHNTLKDKSVELGTILLKAFKQERLSIEGQMFTLMLEKDDNT